MSNLERQAFESYSLPPDYEICLATKKDYWNIYKYELFSNKQVAIFVVLFYLFPMCFCLVGIIIFEPSLRFLVFAFDLCMIFLSYWISFFIDRQVS
ncbi:hypothetical protein, partial [Hyella patelloides]|uniref:hypothetical protein n=1 Tax=Hyella patelloides TaxID=1982969 RepID=UPI001C9426BA